MPVTVNGMGDNDIIVVRDGANACLCDCGGAAVDFNYGGSTVSINGGSGNDKIFGGNGTNILSGSYGDDIMAGDIAVDTITGHVGNDDILDRGGGTERLKGSEDDDCVEDVGCQWTTCSCGSSVLGDQTTCAACADCEAAVGSCGVTCP
jgi:hypothetical protein